ncbi:MAG: hypothetical protein ABR976_02580 [Terracidiphilus sp.]|jgi:hypothetical protein
MKLTKHFALPVYTDVYERFQGVNQDVYTGHTGEKLRSDESGRASGLSPDGLFRHARA